MLRNAAPKPCKIFTILISINIQRMCLFLEMFFFLIFFLLYDYFVFGRVSLKVKEQRFKV